MTTKNPRSAQEIDVHVGSRIKARRQLLGISQEDLAGGIDTTFQQVQKYESGHNRVSASRMFRIAQHLGVTPDFFFEGLATGNAAAEIPVDPMRDAEAINFVRVFMKIGDTSRKHLFGIMTAMTSRAVLPTPAE